MREDGRVAVRSPHVVYRTHLRSDFGRHALHQGIVERRGLQGSKVRSQLCSDLSSCMNACVCICTIGGRAYST